ncbi:glycosyltransferase [Pseudoalteromonas rubra]|nr:glycosyltransferase [Pseudoalteromonas rubra]
MNNLHISLTEMRNESRVLKQASSIYNSSSFESVFISSLWGEGLEMSENLNGVELRRFDLKTRNYGNNLIIQILKYLEFTYTVYRNYRKNNIDIITIHALALLPLGCLLKVLYSSKLVYDAHELETEKNGLGGLRKKLAKWLESILIPFVDHTIVVSNSIADWYKSRYSIENVSVVFNSPIIKDIKKNNLLKSKLGIDSHIKLYIYQGVLSKGRGIDEILDVFGKETADVAVAFMGYGMESEKIKEAASASDKIFYVPAVAPAEVLSYTASADVGISFIEPVCLSYDYCMPNKVFEYLAVGLPVIVSNGKEMSNFVEEHGVGWHASNFSSDELAKLVQHSCKQDTSIYEKRSKEISEKYKWQHQEKLLLEVYKNVTE